MYIVSCCGAGVRIFMFYCFQHHSNSFYSGYIQISLKSSSEKGRKMKQTKANRCPSLFATGGEKDDSDSQDELCHIQ